MWIVISRTIKQLQNYEVVRGRMAGSDENFEQKSPYAKSTVV